MKEERIFMSSKGVKIETDELVRKIEETVQEDRRLTVDEMSAIIPHISWSLLHEQLQKRWDIDNCVQNGS